MRRASLPRPLDRLAGQRGRADLEQTVHEVAQADGLEPAHLTERARRFAPSSPAQAVRRCADELGPTEDEVWAEVALIGGVGRLQP